MPPLPDRPAPTIEPGTRLAISGRAGSGKSYLERWFMLRSPQRWVVLDTKHDPGFQGGGWRPTKRLPSMDDLQARWKSDRIVVARPTPRETRPAHLENWLEDLHNSFENFGCCIDEMYHVVPPGYPPGVGTTGIITRGRVRRQSVIIGSQRPKRVPLFVYSEANAFAVLSLTLEQDRKTLFENTGREEMFDRLPLRTWLYFDVASGTLTRYGAVTIR